MGYMGYRVTGLHGYMGHMGYRVTGLQGYMGYRVTWVKWVKWFTWGKPEKEEEGVSPPGGVCLWFRGPR